jgi:transposase, IS30 family
MVVFSERMLPEVMDVFWGALARGETVTDAAKEVGTYREKGGRWIAGTGGVPPPPRGRHLKGRCLTFTEREEIVLLRAGGESIRGVARRLGRSPSTISRELRRNADARREYRPSRAHALAWQRAERPKPAKLAVNAALREIVEQDLARKYSPAQIAARLRMRFPTNPEMWVSGETIYQSLYVTSRGALKRELTACLRTGRTLRKPGRRTGQRRNRIPDMINIAQRPQEADDRAIPGHWEGDLLLGKNNKTAIGTLVKRTTGYAMLVHLPDGYKTEHVVPAIATKIKTLPESLRRSQPGTRASRCANGNRSPWPLASTCTSATRTRRGNAPATRTPTACCASTSPRAPTSASTPSSTSTTSPTSSTTDPANASSSTSPPNSSQSSCCNSRSNPPFPRERRS